MIRCLLVARKEDLTGVSTGLTGRSKNLDPTGLSTQWVTGLAGRRDRCRSTGPVSISAVDIKNKLDLTKIGSATMRVSLKQALQNSNFLTPHAGHIKF